MKVAYVVSGLRMSFVVNEMEALRRGGWDILPLVSRKGDFVDDLSKMMREWCKQGIYRCKGWKQLAATIRELLVHPLRFSKVCCLLMSLSVHSPLEFVKALYELTTSCYFAGQCRHFGAEHIHVHFASRSLSLGLMTGFLTDLPVSCTVHAFDIFTRSPGGLRPRLAQCKFIVAISQFNVRYLSNACGKSVADLCHVVHCGIDVESFRPVSRQPRPGRMICVCRLSPKKGLDLAIRACAKLRDNNVEFLFEIVGDGPQRQHLEELIRQLDLEDSVKLIGARPNDQLTKLLGEASVFFMPCVKTPSGDMDGIPVAMMEAMACEVPVVSTAISGIPELVDDKVNGRLVPGPDTGALSGVLNELLGDMDKIKCFGKAAREKVYKDFNIYDNAAKLMGLISGAHCSKSQNRDPVR